MCLFSTVTESQDFWDFLSRSYEAKKKSTIEKLFSTIFQNGLINYLIKYEGQILKIVDGINF